MNFIATFYTHFGALSFKKRLEHLGDAPVLQPVPRALSASCGTCVRFELPFEETMADEDVEGVYQVDGEQYRCLYVCEE